MLIPLLLATIAAHRARTSYVAQAQLLVLYGSDYVFHPGNRDTGNDITLDRNQIIEGELQILESPALIAETLRDIGSRTVYPDLAGPATLQTAAGRFLSDLSAAGLPQSNVIALSLRNADRAVAIRALGALISHYLTYRAAIFDKASPTGIETARARFSRRLQDAENALAAFGVQHGISNLDEQVSLLLRQRTAVADEQRDNDEQVSEIGARLAALRQQLSGVAATVEVFAETSRSQELSALTESLVKLEGQRRDLVGRYRDDFPLVRDLDRQIADLKAQIAAQPSRDLQTRRVGRNDVRDALDQQEIGLDSQLQGLRARSTRLDAEMARLQARSQELITVAQRYRALQRDRDVLDQTYRSIAQSSEETSLAGALERAGGANVRLIQPPDAAPAGHNARRLIVAAGVALGLLAPCLLLALLIATRKVFVTVHDVEAQLDMPVLLAVPRAPRGAHPIVRPLAEATAR